MNVGMQNESVEYSREEIKLLEIQVALQSREREVGLEEETLRVSYAEEVSALTTFWSWRVSAMHEAHRRFDEERELQEDVMRKLDTCEEEALFDSAERADRAARESCTEIRGLERELEIPAW